MEGVANVMVLFSRTSRRSLRVHTGVYTPPDPVVTGLSSSRPLRLHRERLVWKELRCKVLDMCPSCKYDCS